MPVKEVRLWWDNSDQQITVIEANDVVVIHPVVTPLEWRLR